jgi:hypothetical protein
MYYAIFFIPLFIRTVQAVRTLGWIYKYFLVNMSTLGERIKIIQIKSGLLQPQFAKSLGISKETLIHYQ